MDRQRWEYRVTVGQQILRNLNNRINACHITCPLSRDYRVSHDSWYDILNARVEIRCRQTALSVSCPCLDSVRIFRTSCPASEILSGVGNPIRRLSISILSAVRILSCFLEKKLCVVCQPDRTEQFGLSVSFSVDIRSKSTAFRVIWGRKRPILSWVEIWKGHT